MSSFYEPHKWLIVEIKPHNLYKVFGTWKGVYVSPDKWRMNSGIKSVIFPDKEVDSYLIDGFSGSTYKCFEDNYGCVSALYNVVENFRILAEKADRHFRIIEDYTEVKRILEENFRNDKEQHNLDDRT